MLSNIPKNRPLASLPAAGTSFRSRPFLPHWLALPPANFQPTHSPGDQGQCYMVGRRVGTGAIAFSFGGDGAAAAAGAGTSLPFVLAAEGLEPMLLAFALGDSVPAAVGGEAEEDLIPVLGFCCGSCGGGDGGEGDGE